MVELSQEFNYKEGVDLRETDEWVRTLGEDVVVQNVLRIMPQWSFCLYLCHLGFKVKDNEIFILLFPALKTNQLLWFYWMCV